MIWSQKKEKVQKARAGQERGGDDKGKINYID